MASLSDTRFSLPDANVAVRQAVAGVDNTLASSIKAFGDIGGEAFKGHLEGQLLNDLQDTGNIINTINAGDDAIRDAVKQGNIDPTSKRFQSLAAATSQGKISQQRASIEAEVLLRESISKAPGFADQFRKTARETLGFDPSSASLNSLFLSGPDAAKSKPLTQEQKDLQQAEAMFSGGAVESVEQGFKLIQQDRANQLRENIQAGQIADGRVNAGKVAVEGANRVTDRLNQVMIGAFAQVENLGGIDDIEAFRGAVLSVRDQVKSKIENEMAASQTHIYSPEEYNQVRARIDEQSQAYVELLENQDLTAVLAKNRTRLGDLVEIAGVQLAPDLAVLAPFGEAVVTAYMDMMTISGGDPVKLQELMKADPTKAFVGGLVLDAASISKSLKGIADGNLGNLLENKQVDEETAKAILVDQANGVAAGKKTDGIDMAKIVQGLSEADMPQTAVSLVAKMPGQAFTDLGETERAVTVQNMKRTQDQQVTTIQRALAATDGFVLSFDGRGFVVEDSQGRPFQELVPFAPTTFADRDSEREFKTSALARSAGVEDAIDYLNDQLTPIMRDQRWAAASGFDDGNQWANTVLTQANVGALAGDLQDVNNPILRQLPLDSQGQLRAAFQSGDIQGAIEILSGAGVPGIGNQPVQFAFRSGVDLTGVSQPILRGETDPAGLPLADVTDDTETLGFEGFRASEYLDPAGIRSIGYGHNLVASPLTAADKKALGIDADVADKDIKLTKEQALELYRRDARDIIPKLAKKIPNLKELPIGAQKALVDMGFNMGANGVGKFKKMLKALADEDFDAAADEMLDSDYARGWVRGTDGKIITDEDGENRVFRGLVKRAQANAARMRG